MWQKSDDTATQKKGIKDLPRPWAYSQLLSHNLQMCEMYKESPDFK